MNKFIIIGRLTRDAEITHTQSGSVARASIAVDRRFRKEGQPTADFINITAFGSQANFMEKFGIKGQKLVCEGRIQSDSYTNKNGQKVYTTNFIVESVEFGESKRPSNNQESPASSEDPDPVPAAEEEFVPQEDEEELPFN